MASLLKAFQPRRLLPALAAGLVAGTICVVIELSFGALIFSGPLVVRVASGIGLTLFGAVMLNAVMVLTSSFTGTLAGPQDSPVAILALIAAAIARSMPASAGPDAIFFTVAAAITLTSLMTGVFFLALGRFKLGNLIRFVPYPVVGGFLAGTGWLVVVGAIGVMVGSSPNLSQLGFLFQPGMLAKWLPGLLWALLLLVILRRYSHFLIMPVMLVATIGLFYILLGLSGTSVADASAGGWLLGPFPPGALWQPFTPASLAQVDWSAIVGQLDKVASILIVAVIALLLNASGLELAVQQDVDLNRELQSAGIANLLAGLGGGAPGYHYLSVLVLTYKMGARGRLAGIFTVIIGAAVLVFGASLLAFFPRPVLGGLLLFLGLSFLVEWVYDAWFKLSHTDYALVLIILIIVSTIGFLEGVVVGVGIAIVLFVVNYSRINIVKHAFSGAAFRSMVDRPMSQRQFLREHGDQLEILRLQGFVFFGTAHNLLNRIRQRLSEPPSAPLRYLVLDFAQVSGLDSSAISSFTRLKQLAEAKDMQLVFTQVPALMESQLVKGGLNEAQSNVSRFLPTLDHGVEWCEDRILASADKLLPDNADTLPMQLLRVFTDSDEIARFMGYLETQRVPAGNYLIRQGDASDAMYFIESGIATVQLELLDGHTIRLRTMRRGTIIGEIALYLGGMRTASVVTTEPSVLYRLSASAIHRMEEQDPAIAAALHKWIARLMAERLAENNHLLAAMLD